MMEEEFVTAKSMGSSFSVVFYDGEQETSLGNVVVSPSLNFKAFQSTISEKLGLSPHQFSIYMTDQNRRGSRIPVTGKIDFSAVSREKDCFFLVVLKRSRRERRRKSREVAEIMQNNHRFDPPANMMLLRRDGNTIAINTNEFSGVDLGRAGYERRVKELQMEKERYLMNMGLGSGMVYEGLSLGSERVNNRTVVCDECLMAKVMGRDVGFHWCVNDTVTFGFRSPAGPIARPIKGSD
ncbi:hypothetical protein JCGZ_08767 [Jatropha curcas]|uniref:DUF7138 domain-containing protein n=1 Tax=Jatropha curcas TaxID=180498 RepID=A0A067KM91_JATCU|nr:uncharacterized protein LOC105635819 [Jatropha curcas]XP_037496321.1 uncharacterized protein LOC105635819 [Jatropha curcas]KDP36123.1 hypothetical protein JCGZ_08767 [Jatropha curcas]